MPVTRASDPVIGVDSSISSPLPAGGPSRISVSTTSASSMSTMRCAVVDPTNPPPTTVTFFRISPFSYSTQIGCIALLKISFEPSFREAKRRGIPLLSSLCTLCPLERFFATPQNTKSTQTRRGPLLRHHLRRHILDDGARKIRRGQLRRAFHHPLEIVRHAFLRDGALDPVFDQLPHLFPSHEIKHHYAGQHHGTRINHVLVRV